MPHFRAMRVRTVADAARRDAAAERRAQWEREDGIPDRGPDDCRTPIALDLSAAGGPRLTARRLHTGYTRASRAAAGKDSPTTPPHSRGSESRGIRV